MFAYSMDWALVWAIGGPRLWPRPLVFTVVGFDFVKCTRVVSIGRLPLWRLVPPLLIRGPRLVISFSVLGYRFRPVRIRLA